MSDVDVANRLFGDPTQEVHMVWGPLTVRKLVIL